MSWIDQGRQEHGYFGHGTAGKAPIYVRGYATYYNLVGHDMANGKPFDPNAMNAAMKLVPRGTRVKVTSVDDPSKSIVVTVTDHRPHPIGNVIDLTPAAFRALFGGLTRGKGMVIVTEAD